MKCYTVHENPTDDLQAAATAQRSLFDNPGPEEALKDPAEQDVPF